MFSYASPFVLSALPHSPITSLFLSRRYLSITYERETQVLRQWPSRGEGRTCRIKHPKGRYETVLLQSWCYTYCRFNSTLDTTGSLLRRKRILKDCQDTAMHCPKWTSLYCSTTTILDTTDGWLRRERTWGRLATILNLAAAWIMFPKGPSWRINGNRIVTHTSHFIRHIKQSTCDQF